jgi:hypothetical protein
VAQRSFQRLHDQQGRFLWLWVALLALAAFVLLGLLGVLAAPAWIFGRLDDPDSPELLEAPEGSAAQEGGAARGPRLEGQPLMAPTGGAGASHVGTQVGAHVGSISGRCVDVAGRGVAGARVLSIPDTNDKVFAPDDLGREGCPALSTTADAEGRFVVPASKAAPYHIVLADAPGLAFAGRGQVPLGGEVTITLVPGRVLEGRVLDVKGAPVSGARVRALLLVDTLKLSLDVESAADGAYRLTGLPVEPKLGPGEWANYMSDGWVEVTADGYAPLLVSLQPLVAARTERQDWILTRGATLRGRVEDAETGKPLAGANVVVHSIEGMQGYGRGPGRASYSNPWSPRVLTRTASQEDGTFLVEHLPSQGAHGSASNNALSSGKIALGGVSAWAPGYAAQALELELARDGEELERTFRLTPVGVVTGRVVEADGTPVAGVHIWVVAAGAVPGSWIPPVVGDVPRAGASTGSDGRFTVPGAPAGRQGPVAGVLTAYSHVRRGVDGQPRSVKRDIRVETGTPLDVGDLVLPEPLAAHDTSTVVILRPDGTPCYGASLGQRSWDSGMRSDAEGRVTVPWPHPTEARPRQAIHMLAMAPGFAPTPVTLPPESVGGGAFEVRLEPGHRLAGRVLGVDGAPARGVMIWVADGRVDAKLAFPAQQEQAHSLVGSVRRGGGRESLYMLQMTDDEGRFAFRDLPAGPYHVRAFGARRVAPPAGTPPLAVTMSEVASDTLDLVVRLPEDDSPPTGTLLVRVLDAATREPVLDATLWARVDGRVVGTSGSRGVPGGPPAPPPPPGPGAHAPAAEPSGPGSEPGTYRLTNLPAGRVVLEVQSAGRRLERILDVEVVADRVTTPPDVRLVRGACVSGRVDLPAGERASERQVLFLAEGAAEDAAPIHAPLAADGTFSVCGFAPGRYAVRCLPQGFVSEPRVLIPAAGPEVVVPEAGDEVRVEGPWTTAGTLRLAPDDARLPPAPWESQAATPERDRFGAGTRVTVTDAAGRTILSVQPVRRHTLGAASLLNLPPGRYVARIQFPDGEAREEQVELRAGATADVRFRKKP